MTATEPAGSTGEFNGDIDVNDKPPTKRDLDKVADLPVLDVNGKPHAFKSLFSVDTGETSRVLIIFIRHFFCGVSHPKAGVQLSVCTAFADPSILTELSRVPSQPLYLHNSRRPSCSSYPNQGHCHRMRSAWSHPDVHEGNSMSVPHLRRPIQKALLPARHDSHPQPWF